MVEEALDWAGNHRIEVEQPSVGPASVVAADKLQRGRMGSAAEVVVGEHRHLQLERLLEEHVSWLAEPSRRVHKREQKGLA